MQTSLEKILKAGKPPQASYEMHDQAMQHIMGLQHLKGDKGDTPQFGTDYFTPEHAQILEDHLRTRLKGEDGMHGNDGVDGKHGRDGKNGVDGKDGKDADTMMIYSVLEQKMMEALGNYAKQDEADDKLSAEEIDSTRKLIDFLKRGGFRGGGSGGATFLASLLDVSLGTLTAGQALVWNGTHWINQSISGSTYRVVQNLAIGTKTITHNLGNSVILADFRVDSTGEPIELNVLEVDSNTCTVYTSASITGVRITIR